METRRATATWVLILEFIVAVLVLAFLMAGPERLDALGRRIRQYLYLQRQPAPTTSAPVSAKPATVRAAVPPTGPPSPPAAAPRVTTSAAAVAPAVTPNVASEPRPQPARMPVKTPVVGRTPAVKATPAPKKTTTRQPTPQPRGPAPTPVAEATPSTLSPQQYFARLMREGYQLYQTGWYGPAMARFKEAARVSPGSATVHLWYGRSALKVGRTADARSALERAIALAPSSDAAREARALLERMSRTE